MTETLFWVFVFFALYEAYCVFWGASSARISRTAADFFLAERQIPAWVFVVAATVMSFTGWTVIGLPAIVFRSGFPSASLALCAITIPLAGVLFLKRQWMLSRRFGYVTPAEMFSDYFGGRLIRLIVLLIALLFALPFLGVQLAAAGYLIQVVSGAAIPWVSAMWILTALVFLYICLGGMRAAAYVGTLQGLLFAACIVAIGVFAWAKIDGFANFVALLAKLGASKFGPWGASAAGYNAYFETPGVVQFVAGIGREMPVGGVWTSSLVLTYCFSLMGLQLAPAFTIGAFATRDVKGFAPQQVWAAGATIGLVLVFFGIFGGMGALFLGGSLSLDQAGLAVAHDLPNLDGGREVALVAYYLKSVGESAPWFAGILAVAAVAAVQATAALYSSATGTIFARDFYKHFLDPTANDQRQKLFGRIGVGLTLLAALILATYAPRAQAELGALALASGFQLLPAAAAICWLPWITRRAAVSGLIAGIVVVVFTDKLGLTLAAFVGIELPWGIWPWMIHPAGWGIVCNIAICLIFSPLTRDRAEREHRMVFHAFLAEASTRAPKNRVLRSVAWAAALTWFFFAVGPGLVIGTDLFGAPNAGPAAWLFGIPSIWAWQIIWWALGVLLLWLLAYKLEMSTPLRERIELRVDGIRRIPQSPRIDQSDRVPEDASFGVGVPLRAPSWDYLEPQ
jgi:Na+/proline symporter